MAVRLNGFQIFLTAAAVWINYLPQVHPSSTGLELSVSQTCTSNTPACSTKVQCSLDAHVAKFETVTSLTLLGSKSNMSLEGFEELGGIDDRSARPNLPERMRDANVVITGEIGKGNSLRSIVTLSGTSSTFGDWQEYKCSAVGLGIKGEAKSLFVTEKLVSFGLSGNCNKPEKLTLADSQLPLSSNDTITEILKHVLVLPNKIDALERKLERFERDRTYQDKLDALGDKLKDLERNVSIQFRLVAREFDMTGPFEGHMYAVSRQPIEFNLVEANVACRRLGGYLLEMDNHIEVYFVFKYLRLTRTTLSFMTGGNDRKKEGTFIYYNSGKPVPALYYWAKGQPDNHRGKEDCIEINLGMGGLNDRICEEFEIHFKWRGF